MVPVCWFVVVYVYLYNNYLYFNEAMAKSFWSSIDLDTKSGVATVLVKNEHLKDFPAFMNHILHNEIGLDVGFFKIRFEDGVQFQTRLEELTTYIHNYYNPRQVGKRKKGNSPSIAIQGFFQGGSCQEWFGYRDLAELPIKASVDPFIAEAKAKFLESACKPESFKTQGTCCLELLCTDEDRLLDHYYDFIRSISLGDHSSSEVVEGILLSASKVRHKYVKIKPQDEQSEPKSTAGHFIMYGAGIPVKDAQFPVTSNFNLSRLGTILDANQEKIPGISYPLLYVGSTHASFPWHIEDQALFSINIVHYGAPCVWLVVPPKFYTKFVQWARFMPLDKSNMMCSNVLGHKYLVASKKCLAKLGIPTTTVIQKEKEIIVTYPYAAHSGFKLGYNIQIAANFADNWWIEAGIFAPSCHCFPTQVAMDLKEIIAVGRPALLSLYLRNDTMALMQAVAKNPIIRHLNLFPTILHVEEVMVSTVYTQTVEEKETEENETEHLVPHSNSTDDRMVATLQSMDETITFHKTAEEMDIKSESNRKLLICPHGLCQASYEGGVGKKNRLIKHIDLQHPGCCECVQIVNLTYPKRQLKEGTRFACHVCGKLIAGSVTHLNEHIKRVHNT